MNKKQFDSLCHEERKRFLTNLPEGLTEHKRTLYFKEKNVVKILYVQASGYTSETSYNLNGLLIGHEFGGQPRTSNM